MAYLRGEGNEDSGKPVNVILSCRLRSEKEHYLFFPQFIIFHMIDRSNKTAPTPKVYRAHTKSISRPHGKYIAPARKDHCAHTESSLPKVSVKPHK